MKRPTVPKSVAGAVAAKLVRPSNGHIAVAEVVEAAAWGQACSCWPVGDLDYLYLGSSRLLYPPDPAPRPGPSSASGAEEEMFVQDLRVNTYLGTALRQGQEVMFRAEDGYWLCPAYLDKQLRQFLRIPTP
eukprot:Tamp_23940.p2 GENE.Tamp_23940~~Tamp_23940.p2  ORF type:complete len:131 (+),score=7.25 Tamp_23940:435-827(+)